DYVNSGLEEGGVTVFDPRSSTGRHQAVARTLDVSLATLDADDRARFAELAIFSEDANIPLITLQRYWGRTGALSPFAVDRLCDELSGRSLLLTYEVFAGAIRLHDVVRSSLAHTHRTELAHWHSILLDAHRPAPGAWADLADDEPYLWEHLATHL